MEPSVSKYVVVLWIISLGLRLVFSMLNSSAGCQFLHVWLGTVTGGGSPISITLYPPWAKMAPVELWKDSTVSLHCLKLQLPSAFARPNMMSVIGITVFFFYSLCLHSAERRENYSISTTVFSRAVVARVLKSWE